MNPQYGQQTLVRSGKKEELHMRKLLSAMIALSMVLTFMTPAMAEALTGPDDTVILYTNDVHTYIDNDAEEENANALTYAKVAALKDSYDNALLVDAGDHLQGTAYGQMDSGETIIKLMNAADYDLSILGNHEFDYGMDGCMQAIEWAQFPHISCNFYHEKDGVPGKTVLDGYRIFDVNGTKVAFLGITTPEIMTSSNPAYFQDDDGNYIYGIAAGADGGELYAAVQTAIDAAEAEGADYVIALGHLGVDASSQPWTSRDVIANTSGLDAFIDGHSHTTMESETVMDKNEAPVILTQTGSYLDAVGKLTISADGVITTELLSGDDLAGLIPDAEVEAIEDEWISAVDDRFGEVIGYAEVTFDNFDSAGNRLVRKQSTNTGDFAADALYYLFDEMGMDVDVAVMNGGGVRNNALTGELTYFTCKEIHPFGNVACLLTVTGQQLMDVLEWGSKDLKGDGSAESGSLLHGSGIKYTLDLSYDSTVQSDDKDVWTGPPTGAYRVKDVQVRNNETGVYEPLDLNGAYNLAGYNYTLRDLGGGFAMLNGAVNVLDYVAEDYMVLANYIQSFPVDERTGLPTIAVDSGYNDVNGSGRINIVTETQSKGFQDVDSNAWYYEAVNYALEHGLMTGVSEDMFAPGLEMSRSMLVTILWSLEGKPVVNYLMDFSDVPADSWYTEAVRWAASRGIAGGYGDGTFGPDDVLTREQLAAILYSYERSKGGGFTGAWMFRLDYPDITAISDWAYEPVCWMTMHKVVGGKSGGVLDPKGAATRAEGAQMLMRYLLGRES